MHPHLYRQGHDDDSNNKEISNDEKKKKQTDDDHDSNDSSGGGGGSSVVPAGRSKFESASGAAARGPHYQNSTVAGFSNNEPSSSIATDGSVGPWAIEEALQAVRSDLSRLVVFLGGPADEDSQPQEPSRHLQIIAAVRGSTWKLGNVFVFSHYL